MKKSLWIAGAVCFLLFGESVYAFTKNNNAVTRTNPSPINSVHHEEIEHNEPNYCNVPNCHRTDTHTHSNHHNTEQTHHHRHHH